MHKKKYNKKRIRYFCIILIIISTIFTFNVTSSRYMGEITTDNEIIALPVLTLSNNNQTYTITDMLPGDKKTYEFIVSNVDAEVTNEVLLSYYFNISIEASVPLTYKLYDITSTQTELTITDGTTENIELDYNTTVTRKYRLELIWGSSDNSYEYANQTITCNVKLEAIQVVS